MLDFQSQITPTISLFKISVQRVENEKHYGSFLTFLFPRTNHSLKIPSEGMWRFFNTLSFRFGVRCWPHLCCCQALVSNTAPVKMLQRLEVCIISISVLIISEGKLSIPLGVWDSSKRSMVVEARVEDFVHYFLCFLSADVPNSQDGAKGTTSDACLSEKNADEWPEPKKCHYDLPWCQYLLVLFKTDVKSRSFIVKGAVSTEVSCSNLKLWCENLWHAYYVY